MKNKFFVTMVLLPFLLSLLAFSLLQTSNSYQNQSESVVNDLEHSSFSDDDVVYVYITKTGKKYHRGNCRHLRKSKIKISLDDAKERGYTPCKVCKPPK